MAASIWSPVHCALPVFLFPELAVAFICLFGIALLVLCDGSYVMPTQPIGFRGGGVAVSVLGLVELGLSP